MYTPKRLLVEIPAYIRKVKISSKQRERYYEYIDGYFKSRTKVAPITRCKFVSTFEKNKLLHTCTYNSFMSNKDLDIFKGRNYLTDSEGNKILVNPKTANTARYITINGQDIYSGNLAKYTRGKVMQAIKESFVQYLIDLPVIDFYPVQVSLEIHDTVANQLDNRIDDYGADWDIGNRAYPYGKAFLDLLVTGKTGKRDRDDNPIRYFTPKLPDDNRLYVTGDPQGGIFTPLPDNDDTQRKLVFIIEEDIRPEIINNNLIKAYHAREDAGDQTPY